MGSEMSEENSGPLYSTPFTLQSNGNYTISGNKTCKNYGNTYREGSLMASREGSSVERGTLLG